MLIIPATISNNVPGTDLSLGADTALNVITEVSCVNLVATGSLIFSGDLESRGPRNEVVVMWIEVRNPTLNLLEFLDHSVDSIDDNYIHKLSEKFGHCRKVLLRHFHLIGHTLHFPSRSLESLVLYNITSSTTVSLFQ